MATIYYKKNREWKKIQGLGSGGGSIDAATLNKMLSSGVGEIKIVDAEGKNFILRATGTLSKTESDKTENYYFPITGTNGTNHTLLTDKNTKTINGNSIVGTGDISVSGGSINHTALYNLLLAGTGINITDTDDVTNRVLFEINGNWKPTYSDSFEIGGGEKVTVYNTGKIKYQNPVENYTYQLPFSGVSGHTYELLAESNVKTLFGSQSIVGSGNIDLYVHKIFFRGQPSGGAPILCAFQWISSNNLKVSSLTDLKTLIGNSFLIAAITYQMTTGNNFEIIGSHISETGIYSPRQIIEDDVTAPMMVWASGAWVDEVEPI